MTFAYRGFLDSLCGRLKDARPVDAEAVKELRSRLDEFRGHWERDGPAPLRETVRATGQPFRFRETMAAMHLCQEMPNSSLPLAIAMRRNMRAAPAGEYADATYMFPVSTWHEVLHRYVGLFR